MTGSVREAVRLAVELYLGRGEVRADHRLSEDLEADSFDLMNMVVILEEDHDIDIPEEAAARVRTVNDLVLLVAELKRK